MIRGLDPATHGTWIPTLTADTNRGLVQHPNYYHTSNMLHLIIKLDLTNQQNTCVIVKLLLTQLTSKTSKHNTKMFTEVDISTTSNDETIL